MQREKPRHHKLVTLLVLERFAFLHKRKTKTVFSWNSRQHLFDSGGESHEWVASYALELTPLESAFNEAYGSRCISSMASTKWSGTRNTPLSEAPKSLAACLPCFREGMSLGFAERGHAFQPYWGRHLKFKLLQHSTHRKQTERIWRPFDSYEPSSFADYPCNANRQPFWTKLHGSQNEVLSKQRTQSEISVARLLPQATRRQVSKEFPLQKLLTPRQRIVSYCSTSRLSILPGSIREDEKGILEEFWQVLSRRHCFQQVIAKEFGEVITSQGSWYVCQSCKRRHLGYEETSGKFKWPCICAASDFVMTSRPLTASSIPQRRSMRPSLSHKMSWRLSIAQKLQGHGKLMRNLWPYTHRGVIPSKKREQSSHCFWQNGRRCTGTDCRVIIKTCASPQNSLHIKWCKETQLKL